MIPEIPASIGSQYPKNQESGRPKKYRRTATVGRVTADPSEATETKRVVKKSRSQTARPKVKTAPGKSTNMIPAEVAIPLPPLNPSQTGKLCPMIAKSAEITPT